MLEEKSFLYDIGASTGRVLLGFLISAMVSIPLGVSMANWRSVDIMFRPFAAFTRYLPISAFIPLLILWVGIGLEQKVWVIFLGIVFHLIVLIADDAARVPPEIIDSAILLGAKRIQLCYLVRFPHALPAIFDDMRIMLGGAWTYLIVAELVAAESGIGKMMIESQRFLKTDRVMAGILTVGIIGLLSDLFFRSLGRILTPWIRFKK